MMETTEVTKNAGDRVDLRHLQERLGPESREKRGQATSEKRLAAAGGAYQ